MKYDNTSDIIASSMDQILKDPEFKSMFSPAGVLEKLAFKRVADEDLPTEVEVEFSKEMDGNTALNIQASSNVRADCINCGKTRPNWTEAVGLCKCSGNGCNPIEGCKDNCSCECKFKQAGVAMGDSLVKSAFDALMKASSDLEEAGFERLATDTLFLMNELVVEAKSKKDKKDDKKKDKEKEKADKEKAKLKAEKDKNAAKDKAMKEKAKLEKEKAKLKAEKEKSKGK